MTTANTNVKEQAKDANVSEPAKDAKDLKVYGDGDAFQLLCEIRSDKEHWMKSTKALEIPRVGCVIQVTTRQDEQVAEALVFVPGVRLEDCEGGGGRRLVQA